MSWKDGQTAELVCAIPPIRNQKMTEILDVTSKMSRYLPGDNVSCDVYDPLNNVDKSQRYLQSTV